MERINAQLWMTLRKSLDCAQRRIQCWLASSVPLTFGAFNSLGNDGQTSRTKSKRLNYPNLSLAVLLSAGSGSDMQQQQPNHVAPGDSSAQVDQETKTQATQGEIQTLSRRMH